jgi:hypothetical protein
MVLPGVCFCYVFALVQNVASYVCGGPADSACRPLPSPSSLDVLGRIQAMFYSKVATPKHNLQPIQRASEMGGLVATPRLYQTIRAKRPPVLIILPIPYLKANGFNDMGLELCPVACIINL